MKISNLYDVTWKIKNPVFAAICYKVNKLLVNFIYPKVTKPVLGIDANSNIIVSLTSFPERINFVGITILTILHQTVKPGKIILWLAEEQFPNREYDLPENLLKLREYGLTIRYCDNLYPHKKYFYTMLENPESTVITVDDDVFYPEYLLEKLEGVSKQYPKTICCTWAHRISLDSKGNIAPYEQWEHHITDNIRPEISLMPVGIGGVLYPPHVLDERVFDKDKIFEIALKTDDLWLKSMEILKNSKTVRIPQKYKQTYFTIMHTQTNGLYKDNVGTSHNDVVIKLLIDNYPQLLEELKEGKENDSKNQ